MVKKRKSDADRVEDAEREMGPTFRRAANSLSQLYAQAIQHQKLVFRSGEKHALEKLYEWILRKEEEGSRMTAEDILSYLQNESDCGEDSSMSQRTPSENQNPPQTLTNPITPDSGQFFQATSGVYPPQTDQTKNPVSSNLLSGPVCESLQSYHLAQVGGYHPDGALSASIAGAQNRESNSRVSSDTSMDTLPESPAHDSY